MINWNKYPYTDFHELNLDWIIEEIKKLSVNLSDFVKLNTIKYANPILWDITSQYEANTVVVDGQTGNAYISTVPVPVGVSITDTEYWTSIFNYESRLTPIENALNNEIDDRAQADDVLQSEIEAEQTARENAIQAEQTARENAIQAEQTARESADNTIINMINNIKPTYFDMVLEGADNTGVVACDDVIDNAVASGKMIYFPAGTYKITRQHTFENIEIVANKAIIHTTSFGLNNGEMNAFGGFNSTYSQMVFKLKDNVKMSGFIFDNIDAGAIVIWGDNCEVNSLYISTKATIVGSTGYYGIVVRNCENTKIHDITVRMTDGNNRDGIHIESQTSNVYISDCDIIAGDDGIAFNSLEGVGGNIYNVFVNNCYVGGYGVRFFGNNFTQVYHVEFNNCTLEVTSPTMQSGCVRFSNSTNTIGGTPIGEDGFFNNINFNNCNFIGNSSNNLAMYCLHAYVACRCTNCIFYNVIYYDESVKDTHIHFANCLMNADINITNNTTFTSIELAECDITGLYKNGDCQLVLTATDTNVSNSLIVTGNGSDYVKLSNCLLATNNVVMNSTGSTFAVSDTRVLDLFTIVAGNATYFFNNLIGARDQLIISSASNAVRISGNIRVDSLPGAGVTGDYLIHDAYLKYLFGGAWLAVNMSAV